MREDRLTEVAGTRPQRATLKGETGRALIWNAHGLKGENKRRLDIRLQRLQEQPHPLLARPLYVTADQEGMQLVMEDPSGVPLRDVFGRTQMRVDQFLQIASQIAEATGALHALHIAHGHLAPDAIFVEFETRKLKLCLHPECLTQARERPSGIEGRDTQEIAYCAPEQSGRTQVISDLRSDLYALGVIFYEMIVGSPPFAGIDKLELIHMHLASPPEDILKNRPDFPKVLAKIVLKLLEKAPADRYQTAYGLLADLRLCRAALEREKEISDFELGAGDKQATFRIPDKLYGRTQILEEMRQKLINVRAGGVELLVLTGPSGSGKSSIANALQNFAPAGAGMIFASGKYDEIQSLPYLGLLRALKDYVLQKLSSDENEIGRLRRKLTEGLGDNTAILTNFLPELAYIVGDSVPDQMRDPSELNQKFRIAFQVLFEHISSADAPLVLFLDDMQWAEAGSIALLEDVLTTASPSYLMVICAARDEVTGNSQRALRLLDTVKATEVGTLHSHIGPLGHDQIQTLIAETMHLESDANLQELTSVIHAKTQGNAFHIRRLLMSLYDEGAIRFDPRQGRWQWTMDSLTQRVVDEDVALLMTRGINRLSPDALDTLCKAAVFGTQFLVSSLRILTELTDQEIIDCLDEAGWGGFVTKTSADGETVYAFSHDMVREAAYRASPDGVRKQMHFKIGSVLLKDIIDPESDSRLFSAMDHIMQARDMISDPRQGRRVTEYAVAGAKRSKAVAAYSIAGKYINLVRGLDPKMAGLDWQTEPEITKAFYMEALEVSFMTGDTDQTSADFDALIQHLGSAEEKALVYQLMVTLHTSRSEYESAIRYGIDGLKLLGVNLSGALAPKIMMQLAATQIEARKHDIFDFSSLPDMQDPKAAQLIEMLMILSTPAFLQNKDLFALISLRMFRLTLREGLTSAGLFSIQNYAIVLILAFKAIDRGYKIGSNLFKLLEPRDINPFVRGRFYYTYSVVVAWRFKSYSELRELLRQGIAHSWKAADLEYVGYYYYSILKYGWLMCEPLDQIADQLKEYERYDKRLGNEVLSSVVTIYNRALVRLTDPAANGLWTKEDRAIEKVMRGEASLGTFYTTELLLSHVFGDWALIEEIQDKLREQEGFATLGPEFVDYHLLLGLSLTRAAPTAPSKQRKNHKKLLKNHLSELRKLAVKYEENHRFQLALLEAEVARSNGELTDALPLYDQAIRKAEEAGIWSYFGIASECAARAAEDLGDETQRVSYLTHAHRAYSQWGAHNKVEQLELAHPALFEKQVKAVAVDNQLDLTSIVKASHLILEVSELDTLQKRLMQITMENAGANSGVLYLMRDDTLCLAAEGKLSAGEAVVTVYEEPQPVKTLDSSRYPREIVSQVATTIEPVVLNDAQNTARFAKLKYFSAHKPRSVLCLPVAGPRGLQAVLWLENTLSPGTFTSERQDILETLTSLASISLSNAMLYSRQSEALAMEKRATEELERLNRVKDEFLATTSHELRTPLNGIIGLSNALADGSKGQLPTEACDTLRLIGASGGRLLALVNDILDLSQLREGALELKRRSVDLHALLDVIFTLSTPHAQQKNITLVNDVPSDSCFLDADEDRLQQILLNLVDNGIKFSKAGTVSVSASRMAGDWLISVEDSGIGIPPEAQSRIFRSFEQVDGSDGRSFGGAGLGLAISKTLIEMHGGEISVKSQPGEGSVFTFNLKASSSKPDAGRTPLDTYQTPLSRVVSPWAFGQTKTEAADLFQPTGFGELAAGKTPAPLHASITREQKFRALVVDDDPINLEVLRNYMQLEGYEVELARDGREALAKLADGPDPDIVLLDVMMPGISGYEVCRCIRETYPATVLPVVILTAKNSVDDLRAGFNAGATDFLAKPFSREELSARVRSHIDLARLSTAYKRFVPVEFLDFLAKKSILDIHLGDNVGREMTIMFSDIRGFTGMAEKFGPDETFSFLNEYFGRMGPIVQDNAGVVNQFLGDGIMSLFPRNADDAVLASVGMMRELRRFNAEREINGATTINIGIGLHTGDLIMGIIGDTHRHSGNVVSDAVNLAARLEGLTAQYGVSLVASEDVINAVADLGKYRHRCLDVVRVVGRERPVTVYEIFEGDHPETAKLKAETKHAFESALDMLRKGQFSNAEKAFTRVLKRNPLDGAAQRLAQRAKERIAQRDLGDSSGIEVLEHK